MKVFLTVCLTLVLTLTLKALSAASYECTCLPYNQCNVDYIINDDATDFHEKRPYNDEEPRPVCNTSSDACCDFKNQTTNKKKNSEWSCGIRGKGDNFEIGEVADAENREFPWVVAIFRNGYGYYAGGSLINENAILTAAHKVHKLKSSELIVHVGSSKLSSDRDVDYEGAVSSIHVHPNFEEGSHINDYAVLILRESAKPTAKVNSICLADSNNTYHIAKCITTGWGKNRDVLDCEADYLLKSRVAVVDRSKCEDNYRKVYENNSYKIHKSIVCAGDIDYRDPCVGESGSPLICPLKSNLNRYVQVGISSIAVCNEENMPGLYANVVNGYQWIIQVVESHGLRTKSFGT